MAISYDRMFSILVIFDENGNSVYLWQQALVVDDAFLNLIKLVTCWKYNFKTEAPID